MEELDLKELFLIFWNRKLEILLITIIALIVGVLYSYFYLTPVYKASTTLILAQSSKTVDKTGDSSITQTDLTLNSKLVSTYSEIMKRKSVLSKVISNLGMSEKDMDSIKKNVSVKAVSDTELIEITVKNKDPEKAALIANEIAKVFSEKVVEIYNISNIYVLDRAEASNVPCNINHAKDLVIFAFIGLVISVIVCLISNMLDTTIKTEEDVEKAIKNFKESNLKKLLLVSQTTFSVEKFNKIVKAVEENIDKNIVFEVKNTICNATSIRQKETQEIAKQVDLMIIIGGKHSSNTTKLYEIAKKECKNCILIETSEELNKNRLKNISKIGIMAGASTPSESINNTVEKLKEIC